MRSAGTWHLTCVERSNTLQTIRKLMDFNKIKRNNDKKEEK